jgi:serine/threonine protein kinase
MARAVGDRLGLYEVLSELGAGGMGEVYRARDATLKRDVALKILPDLFALDQERLARFKREAQVLASLNHSNITAIYGFEESNGFQALVHWYRYAIGGGIFGIGWALTGACPGPLFALLGGGISVFAVTIVAALAGTWTYGCLRSRLPD